MIGVELRELIAWSDHERAKWREWIAADPRRLALPFQPGGRFPTIGSLFDHIFLVERRHLCRLEGGTPPTSTGVREGDWSALWEYADLVRADLSKYVADLDDAEARQTVTVVTQSGTRTMTRRWLAAHIVLHEARHLAQIAYAVRAAGQEPPGRHDIFYFAEGVGL
jgi:uncharacterized damage-inducible protein DinB